MEPSKGMIVNYHCLEGERYLGCDDDLILPAIITRVYPGSTMNAVDLSIFTNQPSSLIARRTSVAMGMTNGGGWTAINELKPELALMSAVGLPIPESYHHSSTPSLIALPPTAPIVSKPAGATLPKVG